MQREDNGNEDSSTNSTPSSQDSVQEHGPNGAQWGFLSSEEGWSGSVRLSRSGANRNIKPLPAESGEAVIARQQLDDDEYSSEDEEEKQPRRSTHINRDGLLSPLEMEGWLNKRGGHRHRFKNWKRRWFILSYPFLMYFEAPQPGGNLDFTGIPLGRISMRGGCFLCDVGSTSKEGKNVRFMLVSDLKTYCLEASSFEAKKSWVDAINRSINFANPAKRPGGVRYEVKYAGESCNLIIELHQITITNSEEQRKFHNHIQLFTKVEHREATNELFLEYTKGPDKPCGVVRMTQIKTPLKTIRLSLEGVLQTWENAKQVGMKPV